MAYLIKSLGSSQECYHSPHCRSLDSLVLSLDPSSTWLTRSTLCSLQLAQNQQISGMGRLIRFGAVGSRWLSRPWSSSVLHDTLYLRTHKHPTSSPPSQPTRVWPEGSPLQELWAVTYLKARRTNQ